MAFNLRKLFGKDSSDEYIEIDLNQAQEAKNKVIVRPFTLRQFDDVNEILNALREGFTIAVIDIKPLKTKDVVELKRSIAKIKKTVEAIEGTVAGFGEHTVIATPQFADIFKAPSAPAKQERADFLS